MDDLDELERELGPSLRLALRRAAADITEQRQPEAFSLSRNDPATPGAWFDDAARDLDALEAGSGEAMVVDLEPAPDQRSGHRRRLVAVAAAALVLLVGSALVWAATRHDAGTQLPAGPTPTSLGAPEVQGPDPASTLLTSWAEFHVGYSFVYADGRVIWHTDLSAGSPYAWERRLNSAGLDLVRSGDLAAEDFVQRDVPSHLWADPQQAGYTASEYAACLWQESADYSGPFQDATDRLADLPAPAQALLHTRRTFPQRVPDRVTPTPADPEPWSACFVLTPEEGRAALDLNGPQPGSSLDKGPPWIMLIPASTGEGAIGLTVFQILPHGEILLWGG